MSGRFLMRQVDESFIDYIISDKRNMCVFGFDHG